MAKLYRYLINGSILFTGDGVQGHLQQVHTVLRVVVGEAKHEPSKYTHRYTQQQHDQKSTQSSSSFATDHVITPPLPPPPTMRIHLDHPCTLKASLRPSLALVDAGKGSLVMDQNHLRVSLSRRRHEIQNQLPAPIRNQKNH